MRFTLFVSSTVKDLQSVRSRLYEHFSAHHVEVLLSEHPSFPVGGGADTLEVCLENVRKADAYVLLIGERFGSQYEETRKSITWLEWEESRANGLDPIILVERGAFEQCLRIRSARTALLDGQPALSPRALDSGLRTQFKDRGRKRHGLVDVERFVSTIESTRTWMHLDWDGSPEEAIRQIEIRLGDLLAGYRKNGVKLRNELRAQQFRLAALAAIVNDAGLLLRRVRSGDSTPEEAALALLKKIAMERGALFQFRDADRFSICLHQWSRGKAVPDPVVRVEAGGVALRGRTRRKGQSHVILAMEADVIVVGDDIRKRTSWYVDPNPKVAEEDRKNFVSVISVPLHLRRGRTRRGGKPNASLTLTSGRAGHFSSDDGPPALTFEVLSRIVSEVLDARKELDDEV